jgi:Domain of unknown function (DUF4123)
VETHPADTIIDALWASPGEEVYAVLDGARDPLVRAKLLASDVPNVCLYEGNIPRELAEVAPYLVKLRKDDRFTRQLLDSAWGKSWGVFASAPADLETLRRHFRRLLRAQDERERTLLFRYYDPRVLRVYLPTCTETELDALFGPLSAYFVEEQDGSHLNVYSRRNGMTAMGRVVVPC